jgi:SAM-dependent methyltransferase
MQIFKLQDQESYLQFKVDHKAQLEELKMTELELVKQLGSEKTHHVEGFSWPIQANSKFLLDHQYAKPNEINFRERLVCHKSKFNNRIRGAIHVFESHLSPSLNDEIYLTEQHSLLYKWLKKKYVNTVGSEYMTASSYLNKLRFQLKLFPEKLNHQDLTNLTFKANQFNHILSFDCFEHIPNYQEALQETHRVVKEGGTLLLSVPFDLNTKKTLVRASMNSNAEITFHVEPEYHGNPVSKQGSLSFYTYGWDLLDVLRCCGFKEVNALIYWSKQYAYLGGEQMLICAKK